MNYTNNAHYKNKKSPLFLTLLNTSRQLENTYHFKQAIYCLKGITQNKKQFSKCEVIEAQFQIYVLFAKYYLWEAHKTQFNDCVALHKSLYNARTYALKKKRLDWYVRVVAESVDIFCNQAHNPRVASNCIQEAIIEIKKEDQNLIHYNNERIFFELLHCHIQLLTRNSALGDSMNKIEKDIQNLGGRSPEAWSLVIYYSIIRLAIAHRTGEYCKVANQLKSLQDAVKHLLQFQQRQGPLKKLYLGAWDWLMDSTLGQALILIYKGCIARNGAEMADAFTSFQSGVELLSKHLEKLCQHNERGNLMQIQIIENLLFDLKAEIVVSHLIQSDFPSALDLIYSLIRSIPSENPNQVGMIPKWNGYPLQAKKKVIHILCGQYIQATHGIREAFDHFQRALDLCPKEQKHAVNNVLNHQSSTNKTIEDVCYIRLHQAVLGIYPTNQENVKATERDLNDIQQMAERYNLLQISSYCLVLRGICFFFINSFDNAKSLLRRGLLVGTAKLNNKKLITAALTYLGKYFLSPHCGNKKQAEEALSSALMLSARMKDTLTQLTVLKLLLELNNGNEEKIEKILLYQSKRKEDLEGVLSKTAVNTNHGPVLMWDIAVP